jgi:hypothetical protein
MEKIIPPIIFAAWFTVLTVINLRIFRQQNRILAKLGWLIKEAGRLK